ncbi:MAG TPA: response regulator [Dehalococcoidia bacterium]|nr:response regulator [Dehalococcoidia bacterium]
MTERRALVVDDDVHIRHVLREMLPDEGYVVREAADGLSALEALATWTPTVIILDLMMPVMDGREFRAGQRALDRAVDVPVVVLSASRQIRATDDLDAAAVIPKPFDLAEMLQIVESVQNPLAS